jgi:peroxiredoxin
MLPLGTPLPPFDLPDGEGKRLSSRELEQRPVLVAFICNHCPYVKHIKPALAQLGRDLRERGVGMVAINANDAQSHPEDAPPRMADDAREHGYTFPYLFDESQALAHAFSAACTPEFYLFDREHRLVYRGQFDDSRPGNGRPVTGSDVRAALDALLSGKTIDEEQIPSIGCSIKWREGNEPRTS